MIDLNQIKLNNDLSLACGMGNLTSMIDLLEQGAQLNSRDVEGLTPLHKAAAGDHADVVAFLVGRGADVNATDDAGWTPLHRAANGRSAATLRAMLSTDPEVRRLQLTHRTVLGETPLHTAATSGAVDLVEALLQAGARWDVVNHKGNTPLHCACSGSMSQAAHALLAAGADANVQSSNGTTPLHCAILWDNQEVVQLLLHHGANPDPVHESMLSPLGQSVQYGFPSMCFLLLEAGAAVDGCSGQIDRQAPLQHALDHHGSPLNDKLARVLIAYGADSSALTPSKHGSWHGMPALHAAAAGGFTRRLLHLLKEGADPMVLHHGKSAFDEAAEAGQHDTTAALQAWQAKQAMECAINAQMHLSASHSRSYRGAACLP